MRLIVHSLIAVVGLVSWLIAIPAVAVTYYTAIRLGTLGGPDSFGSGINNSGQITGYSDRALWVDFRAYLYSGDTMTNLGTLGGRSSYGMGINNSGQVTGWSTTSGDLVSHAFLYSGGTMTDLGTLGSNTNSEGRGINDSGQVVGTSGGRAFLYSGGAMTDLGTLGDDYCSGATGINNRGEVTGFSDAVCLNTFRSFRAFLYYDGKMTDLGTLGGTISYGSGINNRGQITGYSYTAGDAARHAFLYSGGTMTDLGTLGSSTDSEGRGINDSGQVVGTSGGRAFLYSDGRMFDLNSLVVSAVGASLYSAKSINDNGQIVADACWRYGGPGGFAYCVAHRLDPIVGPPAPITEVPTLSREALAAMTLLLLASGLLLRRRLSR